MMFYVFRRRARTADGADGSGYLTWEAWGYGDQTGETRPTSTNDPEGFARRYLTSDREVLLFVPTDGAVMISGKVRNIPASAEVSDLNVRPA